MKLSKTWVSVPLLLMVANMVHAAVSADPGGMMMGGERMMGGWMMALCMLFGLLVLIVLVLAVFALLKYLRSDRRSRS